MSNHNIEAEKDARERLHLKKFRCYEEANPRNQCPPHLIAVSPEGEVFFFQFCKVKPTHDDLIGVDCNWLARATKHRDYTHARVVLTADEAVEYVIHQGYYSYG